VEYFVVFYLLIFNGQEYRPIFLKMEDGRTFNNLEDCQRFGDKQGKLIIESLNEQGIIYKDLMFKCVEEKKQEV
jgi:hypothetical protein